MNGSYIRFAQRNEHHDSKQPALVVFTDDGTAKHRNYISPDDEGRLVLVAIFKDGTYCSWRSSECTRNHQG